MHRRTDQIHAGVEQDFVLDVWQRRKWIAIVVFVAGVAATITVARSLPDLYRATATVLVERQQVSEAFVRPSVSAELETRIQTIHQDLMSRERLTELISRLDLHPELRGKVPVAALADRMRRDVELDFKRVEQTSGRLAMIAFSLTYTSRDPAAAVAVTNTLSTLYVDENTKVRARQAARTAEFLRAQLADVKRELDAQESRVSEYKARYDGQLPEQVAFNLVSLERLNTKLRANAESRSRVIERRQRLDEQLAASGSRTAAATALTPAAAQLATLRQKLAGLRRQYSDRYPDVVRVAGEIAALEEQVQQEEANGHATATSDSGVRLKEMLAQLDRELNSLNDEEAVLRRAIAQYEDRIANAPKRQQELQQLSSETTVARDRYESLLKRYEEAQLAESLEQGQNVEHFRILDPAIFPTRPAAPNREWLLLLGLFVSLGLAFATVVAVERLDTSFHTVDELRSFLNLPVLATIRVIPTAADARRQRLRVGLLTVLVILGLLLIVSASRYVTAGNESIVRRLAHGFVDTYSEGTRAV